jgi:pimeloyl-ACP methyl ester carboxylesterase
VLATIARTLPSLWQVSRDELRAVRVPVLAIAGELDQRNLEAAKRMAGVVLGLQPLELRGGNHATSVRPSAAHIADFLDWSRCEARGQQEFENRSLCW